MNKEKSVSSIDKKNKPEMGQFFSEYEESFSGSTEEALFSFQEVCDSAVLENKETLEKSSEGAGREACLVADKKIDEAAEKQELAIVKAFKDFIAKTKESMEKKRVEKKSDKIYKKVGEIVDKTSHYKLEKSWKKDEAGDSRQLNKDYDKAFKKFPEYIEEFKSLNPEYLDDFKLSNVKSQMTKAYNRLIFHKLKNNEIDEAIELWRDCPKNKGSYQQEYSHYDYMITDIRKKLLEESGNKFDDNTEGHLKEAEYLKERLKDYPDVYLGCIGKYVVRGSYTTNEYRKAGVYDEAVEAILTDENLHSAINFIDIGENLINIKSNPDLIKIAFKEYLEINPRIIKDNLALFADEINELSKAERLSCLEKCLAYSGDLGEAMNFIKLNDDEVEVLYRKLYSDNSRDSQSIKEITKLGLGYGNDLSRLTNAEYLEISREEQLSVFEELKSNSKINSLNFILLHPEKYPNLNMADVSDALKNAYVSDANYISRLFLDSSALDNSQKKEVVDEYFGKLNSDGRVVWGSAINILRRDGYLMNEDQKNYFSDKLTTFSSNVVLYHDDIDFLEEVNPELAIKLINNAKSVDSGAFINKIKLGGSFFQNNQELFLKKISNLEHLINYLSSNQENIGQEKMEKNIELIFQHSSIKEISSSEILNSYPEYASQFLRRVLNEGKFEDLRLIFSSLSKYSFDIADKQLLMRKMVEIADEFDIKKFIHSGHFVSNLDLHSTEDWVNLFLDYNNPAILEHININDLSDETKKRLVDSIVSSGSSRTHLAFLEKAPDLIDFEKDGRGPKPEKIDELVELIINQGTPVEQVRLLKGIPGANNSYENKLSPDDVELLKKKIMNSDDGDALLSLAKLINDGTCSLNSHDEKEFIKLVLNGIGPLKIFALHEDIFDFSKEEREGLLISLSNESEDYFHQVFQDQCNRNYLDSEAKTRIIDNYLAKYNGVTLTSYYCRGLESNDDSELGFEINSLQLEKIADNILGEQNRKSEFSETFLSNLYSINGQLKENKLILSEEKYRDLLSVYFYRASYNSLEEIASINETVFHSELEKFLGIEGNVKVFLSGVRNWSNIKLFSGIKDKIITDFKEKEKTEKSNPRAFLNFYSILAENNLLSKSDLLDVEKLLGKGGKQRENILDFSKFVSAIDKGSDKGLETFIDPEVAGRLKEFRDKYSISEKGKTIFMLEVARTYKKEIENNRNNSLEEIMIAVEKRLSDYDKVISSYNPQDIPDGFETSIGIEYEVTSTISTRYNEKTGTIYTNDVIRQSDLANIGKGKDAVHEFALKPTNNPYLLLLETKLLQDLDYIDFNFLPEERGGYQGAASGYHFTLGGEKGLKADDQVNFLQNTILAANFGGVYSGSEVTGTAQGRQMSLRERGTDGSIKVFDNVTSSVELRCLSVDKFEQFERAILSGHYGAIAVQATNEYIKTGKLEYLQALRKQERFPENSQELFNFLKENNYLNNKEIEVDDKVKDIIYEWLKLQRGVVSSVDDHNENFLENETVGYLDEEGVWVDASEFTRGRNNENAFSEVIKKEDYKNSLIDYFEEKLTITASSMFNALDADLANKFTRLNNLYLKGDKVNILNMLNTTVENGFPTSSDYRGANDSVFNTIGEKRRGRYYLQGSSDKLLINRAQDLLLNFLDNMEKVLAKKQAVELNEIAA